MINSDYIAVAALFVALLAMFATFWQAHIARSYSRISVRPHLDWGVNRFPGKPVAFFLVNNGLGPAIIKSFTLTLDGKSYPIEHLELPKEIVEEVSSIDGLTEWKLFSKNTPIACGDQINIFLFENKSLGLSAHNQAISFLERLGIEIEYSSMFKEEFQLSKTAKITN